MVGFGLWNSLVETLIVEISIFAVGVFFILESPRQQIGNANTGSGD
jgi:hypothetical protein